MYTWTGHHIKMSIACKYDMQYALEEENTFDLNLLLLTTNEYFSKSSKYI